MRARRAGAPCSGGLQIMRSVLVVDDYSDIRDFLKLALEAQDCRVEIAKDGATALELAEGEFFDVILIDINMPGMSGVEFVRAYRALPIHQARLVVMTAGYRSKQYAEQVHADAYLVKPFDVDHVVSTVMGLLEVEARS
jgi:CheY-like chemotaxis protein